MKKLFSVLALVICGIISLITPCSASQETKDVEENLFHHGHGEEHGTDEHSSHSEA